MAIATLADYQAAAKQYFRYGKDGGVGSTFGNAWLDNVAFGGYTGGRSTQPGNTTSGVVPTKNSSGVGGFGPRDFTGRGYITQVEGYLAGTTAVGRVMFYDTLFVSGPHGNNTTVTLTGQPSYSARIPGGTDYTGLKIFLQYGAVTGGAHVTAPVVTYTNESGTTGRTAIMNPTDTFNNVGHEYIELGLQAGDCGVQTIESVTIPNNATTMTLYVCVLRPLVVIAGLNSPSLASGVMPTMFKWLDKTGMVEIFSDSIIDTMVRATANSSTTPSLDFDIEIATA